MFWGGEDTVGKSPPRTRIKSNNSFRMENNNFLLFYFEEGIFDLTVLGSVVVVFSV